MQEEKDIIEKAAEIPISAVKTTVKVEEEGAKLIGNAVFYPIRKRRSIKDFFWRSKSGIITGSADNDPSGIVTYTQTGAVAGYNLLWMILIAWPMLTATEEISARIGIITKKGLNTLIRENYGSFWAYLLITAVIFCNIFTMGADIAAMSDVAAVLTGWSEIFFVLLFGGLFFLLLWKKGYKEVSRYLFLLTPIFLLYIVSAFMLPVPWGHALKNTILPDFQSLNFSMMMIAVAFLGTTITPALLYWETSQEIEEKIDIKKLKKESRGVAVGMFFSQFITFFIIVAAAAVFAGQNRIIETAREAALALKPLGSLSFSLFAIGILCAGFLSIPVISASTGYTFAETFNLSKGLDKTVHQARGFYVVMGLSLLIGVIIALVKFNPILALLYSQVATGLICPLLLIFLILISNNKKIMGIHTNRFWSNFFGIMAILVMMGTDIALIIDWIK
ncbi:hypothetical protein A2V71_01660 [Candidatus Berkelbacteria bacterium RBG_13_40_8]|uniref:Iron transporter n=1 Tax=Candidatus Berkelbacteria bacterium RBG_13_40_8 TaxID=1797467 RepID=A0A1F5DPS4_9BACT|nr:MAG: hypothetical protein A2V71_01660 [Candidatus Berkelbacteria bacterium RBG_13_40_8]